MINVEIRVFVQICRFTPIYSFHGQIDDVLINSTRTTEFPCPTDYPVSTQDSLFRASLVRSISSLGSVRVSLFGYIRIMGWTSTDSYSTLNFIPNQVSLPSTLCYRPMTPESTYSLLGQPEDLIVNISVNPK